MYSWLLSNRLMLSKDKTKLAIISSRFRSRSAINSVFVSDELIHLSSHVSNLGVLFDEGFSFDKHISSTCKAAFYHLRNIAGTHKEIPGWFLLEDSGSCSCYVPSRLLQLCSLWSTILPNHKTSTHSKCGRTSYYENTEVWSYYANFNFSPLVTYWSQNKF